MGMKLKYITPLLAAGAAAVAIAAGPTAFAANQQSLLGNRLPVARQRSDQDSPAPRSVPPLRASYVVFDFDRASLKSGLRHCHVS